MKNLQRQRVLHKWIRDLLWTMIVWLMPCYFLSAQEHETPKTLPLGSKAPDFRLKGVDDKIYTLKSFSKSDILVIIFSAPHCPTAQAYEERIKAIQKDYQSKGVRVVMVNPNNPMAVCLEERGYTDLGDSFPDMKQRAKDQAFNFPFLDDGEKQEMAMVYGPVATPHVFIFDKTRILRYCGRIDDSEKIGTATQHDTRNALDALITGKEVQVKETKVFGCSIQWKWKTEYRKKLDEEWGKKEVRLEKTTIAGIKSLLQNSSEKLRVVTFWATWCGPCIAEFSDLVETYRMFQARDFELYTISLDKISQFDKVNQLLTGKKAALTGNLILGDENKYELIEAVDKEWKGNIPFTLMVEPGGKIVHRFPDGLKMLDFRRKIVEHPLIGRYF